MGGEEGGELTDPPETGDTSLGGLSQTTYATGQPPLPRFPPLPPTDVTETASVEPEPASVHVARSCCCLIQSVGNRMEMMRPVTHQGPRSGARPRTKEQDRIYKVQEEHVSVHCRGDDRLPEGDGGENTSAYSAEYGSCPISEIASCHAIPGETSR